MYACDCLAYTYRDMIAWTEAAVRQTHALLDMANPETKLYGTSAAAPLPVAKRQARKFTGGTRRGKVRWRTNALTCERLW